MIFIYFFFSLKSFQDIEVWLRELKSNSSPDIKIFLLGNKVDLEEERTVIEEEGRKLMKDYDLDYFLEASAKSGFNSREIFIEAAKLLYNNYNKFNRPSLAKANVRIIKSERNKEGGCGC